LDQFPIFSYSSISSFDSLTNQAMKIKFLILHFRLIVSFYQSIKHALYLIQASIFIFFLIDSC